MSTVLDDTAVLEDPIPGFNEDIDPFTYTAESQGLSSTGLANVGLVLLSFPPYADPRIVKPTVVSTILYSHQVMVTKEYRVAGQAPWFYGTSIDDDRISGWFQKE